MYLNLDHNKLTDLPRDILIDLYDLVSLNLDFNQFTAIPNQAISSVHSLQHLSFVQDLDNRDLKTTGIDLNGFQNLTNLKTMFLTVRDLQTTLNSNTFQQLSHSPLQSFSFIWSWISKYSSIDGEIFSPLTNVTKLVTRFDALPSSESVPPLLSYFKLLPRQMHTLIVMKKNTLQNLQKLNSSLTHLSFNGNPHLEQIDDDSFIWTPSLIILDLTHNGINNLAIHAFRGLRSLQKLLLHKNHLTKVPTGALFAFDKFWTLQYLDLSANRISSFDPYQVNPFYAVTPYLKYLIIEVDAPAVLLHWMNAFFELNHIFIKGSKYKSTNQCIFFMLAFPRDIIKTFQVTNTGTLCFGIKSLCSAFPYLEVAIIPDIKFFHTFQSDLELVKCSRLLHLDLSGSVKNIASLDLDNLNITISTLNKLNMARNQVQSIKQIIFIKAPMLAKLDLSHNLIKSIGTDLAMSFPNLESLNVDGNVLESIAGLQSLSFLQKLSATRNQITSIPPWFVSKASTSLFMELDLSFNPFQCTCDIEPFRKWILYDTNTWLQPGQYVCATPETLKGVSITAIELDCRSKTPMYLGVGFAIGILFCMLLMTLFKYRWHIKYKLVLLYRNYQPIPDNIEEDFIELNLRHHAYVAYNDESADDTAWVMDNLHPNMEEDQEPLRLFIKSRDAIPGHSIIQSIEENIQQSRKTILVLSPNFVDSNWCHHEMEMAKMRFFNDNLDVLILVLLKDIPEQKVPLLLRQLLCKKKYLKWPKDRAGQRLFWQRLRLEIKGLIHADLCFQL